MEGRQQAETNSVTPFDQWTQEQQEAYRGAWKASEKKTMTDPNAAAEERARAAQLYLERSTNPGNRTDSEMPKKK